MRAPYVLVVCSDWCGVDMMRCSTAWDCVEHIMIHAGCLCWLETSFDVRVHVHLSLWHQWGIACVSLPAKISFWWCCMVFHLYMY